MYLAYVYVCFLAFLTVNFSESKLSSLFVIHRHADRTPVITYPTDPYACNWKQGYGVLVERGIQRMRDFGKIFRERYGDFWPQKSDLEIRSTSVDRVIKSVQYLLEGIYSDNFYMHPTSIEISDSRMLYPIVNDCPRYTQELQRLYNTPAVLEWLNGEKRLLDYLSDNTGMPNITLDVDDRLNIVNLHDVFLVQKQFNLTLPQWMNNTIYDQLTKASTQSLMLQYSTELLQRLSAGLILKEIQDQMEAIEAGKFKKVHIYSTHDAKITALLMSLNAFNHILPPYGSSVIFEFHWNGLQSENNFVKSYYLNDTSTQILHPLILPGCGKKDGCSFENFKKSIENLIPDDLHECGNRA